MNRRGVTKRLFYLSLALLFLPIIYLAIPCSKQPCRRAAIAAIYRGKRERSVHGSEQRGTHARERTPRGSVVGCGWRGWVGGRSAPFWMRGEEVGPGCAGEPAAGLVGEHDVRGCGADYDIVGRVVD
jgi:hypothetical protein